MTKLIVAFRSFANAPKNDFSSQISVVLSSAVKWSYLRLLIGSGFNMRVVFPLKTGLLCVSLPSSHCWSVRLTVFCFCHFRFVAPFLHLTFVNIVTFRCFSLRLVSIATRYGLNGPGIEFR
jgi:hypothetical protein